jgi:hypothetical protein
MDSIRRWTAVGQDGEGEDGWRDCDDGRWMERLRRWKTD